MKRDLSNCDFEMAMKTRTISTKNELHQVFIVTRVLGERGGGGGGAAKAESYSTKFDTERLRPEVQTLTFLLTIFDREGTLFVYLSC